jgi:hypothetical protein
MRDEEGGRRRLFARLESNARARAETASRARGTPRQTRGAKQMSVGLPCGGLGLVLLAFARETFILPGCPTKDCFWHYPMQFETVELNAPFYS